VGVAGGCGWLVRLTALRSRQPNAFPAPAGRGGVSRVRGVRPEARTRAGAAVGEGALRFGLVVPKLRLVRAEKPAKLETAAPLRMREGARDWQ
jgi:hypothetical protein